MRIGVAEDEERTDRQELGDSVRIAVCDDAPVRLRDAVGLLVDPAEDVTVKLPRAEFDTLSVCVDGADCVRDPAALIE